MEEVTSLPVIGDSSTATPPAAERPEAGVPREAPPIPLRKSTLRWHYLLPLAGVAAVALFAGGFDRWVTARELAAQQALDAEDYDAAHQYIETALRYHSQRFSTNLLAARIDRSRRSYPDAERHLLVCKELGGMTEELQIEFLLVRCERGEVDELAPQLLALVRQNHPESAAILESMALVHMRLTRYPEALGTLDQWIKLAPDSARAHEWRGWVCNQMDRRGDAIDDYVRALELQPGRTIVRLRLAQMLIDSSRHAEALPHLERLLRLRPDNPDVLVGLAACRIVQLRVADARSLLEKVLDKHPDHFAGLLLLGNLEREEGRYAEAEHWLREAIKLKPLDPTACYALHLTLLAQPGRQQDAERERQLWNQNKDAIARLARLLRGELNERPRDADLAAEAGELLLRQGEDQRGLYWLDRALKINPGHPKSHQALAEYYQRTGNPALAQEHRRQALRSGSTHE